ncbi:DUF6653 family protein [Pelagibacterium halotolerans]|uniref:Uncharacterized protein n=1 Tax=Pelagibacterium halotolerans (strain DSM 22347 / JCM 15775 / CGMCC 1.7692 / B2) TaxID=1082931 RepID=G4RBV0_PELHB|nr:DUF6653 family protein [Pelagibacterium halotolerans]AEQ50613.1 hypothetical protein KKY_572 [Pelagibacterium halotolerans B2]QJR19447.1 hypothetical protein HKM20_13965 [Pelagibacterium halotolerans]SDZ91076.1 hypothetical protein SAMN05428936_101501 [Pelagibacterium halotolerans]
MRLDTAIETGMGMTDDAWLRHANPWSVWTRLMSVPAFALAVWSREWIGWWCVVPIGLVVGFLWLNTRIFPPATDANKWETRAIMGERLWLKRKEAPLPAHHARATSWIVAGSSIGVLPLIAGLYWLDVWATVLGIVMIVGGQLWFLDRLAWLHADSAAHTGQG